MYVCFSHFFWDYDPRDFGQPLEPAALETSAAVTAAVLPPGFAPRSSRVPSADPSGRRWIVALAQSGPHLSSRNVAIEPGAEPVGAAALVPGGSWGFC
jgi:hypothetical protein